MNWEQLREDFKALWDSVYEDDEYDTCKVACNLLRGLIDAYKLPANFDAWWQRFRQRVKQ